MRRLDPVIGSMYDCPRGIGRSESSDRFSDGYGAYLAGHALQIVAGRYLRSKPVVRDKWEDNPWLTWLRRYCLPDVLWWASDLTDPFPYDLPSLSVDLSDPRRKTSSQDRVALASLCDLPRGNSHQEGSWLLDAQWDAGNETTVSVSSVLVSRAEATRFATALALIDPTFQHIPSSSNLSGRDKDQAMERILVHALDEPGSMDARIDDGDPYGTSSALSRMQPTVWSRTAFRLANLADQERRWIDSSGSEVFRLEYWGARFGRGRHEQHESGYRVTCPKNQVLRTLNANGLTLVVLVEAHHYLKDPAKSYGGALCRRSSVVVVDGKGVSRPILRMSSKIRAAWKA